LPKERWGTLESMGSEAIAARVSRAADGALAEKAYVAFIDVLVRMRWLEPSRLARWRQGRVATLENATQVDPGKLSAAMDLFCRWASERGLQPSETDYLARTRDHRKLQFSVSGDPAVESAYRTHWISPALPETERRQLTERQSQPPELLVVNPVNDWSCSECSGSGDLLIMEEAGPLCMTCADLDHLVFLPRGDAALTRRAKKSSSLSAVVVRFSRARGRYERQGILVEDQALERAEVECLADEEARGRRRAREEEHRAEQDSGFQTAFAAAILERFPRCPTERAKAVANHAAARASGRIGRSASGRALVSEAVTLAVVASVRHVDTRYDELLMSGVERAEARALVRVEADRVLEKWSAASPSAHGA